MVQVHRFMVHIGSWFKRTSLICAQNDSQFFMAIMRIFITVIIFYIAGVNIHMYVHEEQKCNNLEKSRKHFEQMFEHKYIT